MLQYFKTTLYDFVWLPKCCLLVLGRHVNCDMKSNMTLGIPMVHMKSVCVTHWEHSQTDIVEVARQVMLVRVTAGCRHIVLL